MNIAFFLFISYNLSLFDSYSATIPYCLSEEVKDIFSGEKRVVETAKVYYKDTDRFEKSIKTIME